MIRPSTDDSRRRMPGGHDRTLGRSGPGMQQQEECLARAGARDAREWIRRFKRGDLEGAWALTDRIRARSGPWQDSDTPRHLQQVWNGSDMRDRRILIRCYHGLGDTIQFIRYAPLVQSLARELIVWAQPALLPLLRSTPDIGQLLPLHDGSPEVEYDVDIEIMELPYAFRTTISTIPNEVPYLTVEPAVLPGRRPRVGLVWRAGEWDQRRSMSFHTLATLFEIERVSWYGLQADARPDEVHPKLHSLVLGGVMRTAQVMRGLDLVISIDSMTAHLAGALGIPVWTLLAHDADWRWMQDRNSSPWYPTMRLFRQPVPGDWPGVMTQVRRRLTWA